jgi:bifunctional non-homologous end joining protein LigD
VPKLLREAVEPRQTHLRRRPMPRSVHPMLATLSQDVFSDPAWIYEIKLDGQRSLLFRKGSSIRLVTRNLKDRTSHYPELVDAIARATGADLIADGEIVAFDGQRTSFSRLQGRMGNSRPSPQQVRAVPVHMVLFDLLWFDGYDITALPLVARKEVLRRALAFRDPLHYSEHIESDGEPAYRAACEQGLEGVVAKRAQSPYTHGRSRDWLKFKCLNEQEFVVVGWTDPQGSRPGIGALLVGYHDGPALRFAGKVGTGFGMAELARLARLLSPLERADPPVSPTAGLPKKGIHWVRPELVAQVGFSEWTPDGKLRHPRYLGLRDDKEPGQVIRERP